MNDFMVSREYGHFGWPDDVTVVLHMPIRQAVDHYRVNVSITYRQHTFEYAFCAPSEWESITMALDFSRDLETRLSWSLAVVTVNGVALRGW